MYTKSLPLSTPPARLCEELETAGAVFFTASELAIRAIADGDDPMDARCALEAALYDLRPGAEDLAALYALSTSLAAILAPLRDGGAALGVNK